MVGPCIPTILHKGSSMVRLCKVVQGLVYTHVNIAITYTAIMAVPNCLSNNLIDIVNEIWSGSTAAMQNNELNVA